MCLWPGMGVERKLQMSLYKCDYDGRHSCFFFFPNVMVDRVASQAVVHIRTVLKTLLVVHSCFPACCSYIYGIRKRL